MTVAEKERLTVADAIRAHLWGRRVFGEVFAIINRIHQSFPVRGKEWRAAWEVMDWCYKVNYQLDDLVHESRLFRVHEVDEWNNFTHRRDPDHDMACKTPTGPGWTEVRERGGKYPFPDSDREWIAGKIDGWLSDGRDILSLFEERGSKKAPICKTQAKMLSAAERLREMLCGAS